MLHERRETKSDTQREWTRTPTYKKSLFSNCKLTLYIIVEGASVSKA
mgnify:FL=1